VCERNTWQHSIKDCPFVTLHLALKFSNKYMFITTWILIQKWWLKSYRCLCFCKWTTSKRFLSSSSGTNPRFVGKLRNYSSLGCRMPFLRNGYTRERFGFKYPTSSSWLYIEILFELFHWVFVLMALHLCFHCSWKWRPRNFLIA